MRKWQNLAPKNDQSSFGDLDGFWPTLRGAYETSDFLSGTALAATSASAPIYAFVGQPTTGVIREFVVDASHVWEYAGGTLADRTGGISIDAPFFCMYGNVAIAAMGTLAATAVSTGLGINFAALAGAPKAKIAVTQSNCLLLFNTDSSGDGWAASDVGDYTNWTTGEAASGRLLATPGPIRAAVAWRGSVIVFKANSVYRVTYVGGLVKWATELLYPNIGVSDDPVVTAEGRFHACAGLNGILFCGKVENGTGTDIASFYYWDGINSPRKVNPLTTTWCGRINYDPAHDLFTIWTRKSTVGGATYYSSPLPINNSVKFYCAGSDMWGKSDTPFTTTGGFAAPCMGEHSARTLTSPMPCAYTKETNNQLKRFSPMVDGLTEPGGDCYVETMRFGDPETITTWNRAIPILNRRRAISTDTMTLTGNYYDELDDTSTALSEAYTESPTRKRFDFVRAAQWASFKLAFTNTDAEILDLSLSKRLGGQK
jgi:hypothetical protein